MTLHIIFFPGVNELSLTTNDVDWNMSISHYDNMLTGSDDYHDTIKSRKQL